MNRRRVVYPLVAIAAAGLILLGDRMTKKNEPAKRELAPPAYVPPADAPRGTMSAPPKPKNEPPVGRPADRPPVPGEPAMEGKLQVEPVPVPPREGEPAGR